MDRQRILAVVLAVLGFGAVAVGIHQELLHVAPGYAGTIETGWGGRLNHEEYLLARLGAVGVAGTVATMLCRYVAVVPGAVGAVELGYSLRAVSHYARDPGLYTPVQTHGETTRLVLGAEPFLLVAGGLLFVGAALLGWRSHRRAPAPDDSSTETSPRV